jgi:poly(hydroxyalkanoate) granule-associated protein
MVKKLKALAGGTADNQFAQTVKDSAQQIWLAGLGAFVKAQAEGMKAFNSLVKEGETLQSRTSKAASEKVAEAAAKASGTWDKLEQVFEDRVARSLSSLGVPTKKDIETLSRRVAELTEVVQKLNGAAKPTRRSAK